MDRNNNRRRFFYNGILLTAVGLGMRTVSLFFNAFITRQVGAEGVGLYTVVMTVYNFAVTFATSGISLTVTRLVAEARGEGREDDLGKILSGSIIYALIFSVAASLTLYFGAGFFAGKVLRDLRCESCLKILSPSLVPIALVSVFSGYFVGVKRVTRNAITQISGQLFKIGITVFLITRVVSMDVERSAVALSLGTTLTELLCFLVIFLEYLVDRRGKSHAGADVSSVARGAAPLAISAYIRQALLTVEHILIPSRLKKYGKSHSESLASYGTLNGMALPTVIYPMATLSSFAGLLVPEFAERGSAGDTAGMSRLTTRAFEATMRYAIAVSVFLLIFSEELGYVIYSSREAGIYIAVLAAVVPIMYLDHVTDSILKGIGEQVYSMWINITDSLLSIALVWVLIPRMGIMGYAVCIILMELYNFVLSLIKLLSRIRFKINWKRSVIFPLLAAFLSALLSRILFVSAGAQTSAVWLVLEMVFAVCVFLAGYKIMTLASDIITPKILAKCKR